MRLSEVLSRPPTTKFEQVEGFLGGNALKPGKQRQLKEGIVALNYFCVRCSEKRTFCSSDTLYCIGVNGHIVSLDCVLHCHCGSSVQIWFLIDCDGDISGRAPEIRILKRSEKLSETALLDQERYGEISVLLEMAQRAYRERLGAGSMVYLRKIFEKVTTEMAFASGINCRNERGKRKSFKDLLKEVDEQKAIIPREFSANGYTLFSELSSVVHGDSNEEVALSKYDSLYRLIVGILDNIKNNSELMSAIKTLGWDDKGNSQ